MQRHTFTFYKFQALGLAQTITVHCDLQKDRVFLDVTPVFHFLVLDKLCPSEAGVLLQFGSSQERLVFRTGVGFDAEFNVLALLWVFILIQEVESDSVVKRPLEQSVESSWDIRTTHTN